MSTTTTVTTSAGTALYDRATRVTSPDDAAVKTGRGSELHLAAIDAYAQSRNLDLWIGTLTPGADAVAGSVTITPTISSLTAGTLRVTVCGRSVDIAISASDAVTAIGCWRATHAGPSIDELYTTVATLDSTALVLEVALDDVMGTDPEATQRFVVLLGDGLRADEGAVSRLSAALSVEAPAQVQFTFGRHHGGASRPRFRCAFRGTAADSRCDRDVLAR